MPDKSIVSPEDQGATFVELFFDLVFVFAITQITHYASVDDEPDVPEVRPPTLEGWPPPAR